MTTNVERIGNFSSSNIVALRSKGKQAEGFGVTAITYIAEKRMERLLGRSIDDEVSARPLTWGKLLESRVFDLLGTDYTLTSLETDIHPEIPYWVGSKDGTREGENRAITETKCPITLKSFCQLVMPIYCGLEGMDAINAIRNGFTHNGITYEKHKSGEKYYQQIVSNGCINNTDWAELIVYMPYQSELKEIREMSEGNKDAYWIWASEDTELPHLKDGGYFKNLNIIRFQIPNEDKYSLREDVLKGGKLLEDPSTIIISGDKVGNSDILIVEPASLLSKLTKI